MRSKQPKALYVLFLTELWERFGYYTMISLMVLYLTRELGMEDGRAGLVFGAYLSLAYLATIGGGFLAERVLGFGRAIIAGATLMALGYFVLATGGAVALTAGLSLLVAGMGLFKANVSALLGRFYDGEDPRRSSGFIVFYMGIKMGALLGSLSAGYVAEAWGYGAAFILAGIGKLLAVITYLAGRRWIAFQDAPPAVPHAPWHLPMVGAATVAVIVVSGLLFARPGAAGAAVGVAGAIGFIVYVVLITRQPPPVRRRLTVHLVLVLTAVVFFSVYQQYTISVTLFTEREVDRTIFGAAVPASEFTSLNAAFILMLGPILAALWPWLAKRGFAIHDIVKFAAGLALLGIAYATLGLGIIEGSEGVKTGLAWLVSYYFIFTLAEMFLSPVGLALTTALASRNLAGMAMGIWFLAWAGGDYLAGLLADLAAIAPATPPAAEAAIYQDAFFIYGAIGIAAAIALAAVVPRLIRMSRA